MEIGQNLVFMGVGGQVNSMQCRVLYQNTIEKAQRRSVQEVKIVHVCKKQARAMTTTVRSEFTEAVDDLSYCRVFNTVAKDAKLYSCSCYSLQQSQKAQETHSKMVAKRHLAPVMVQSALFALQRPQILQKSGYSRPQMSDHTTQPLPVH